VGQRRPDPWVVAPSGLGGLHCQVRGDGVEQLSPADLADRGHDESLGVAFQCSRRHLVGESGLADPADAVDDDSRRTGCEQFHRPAALLAAAPDNLTDVAAQHTPAHLNGGSIERWKVRIDQRYLAGGGQHGQYRPLIQLRQLVLAFVVRVLQFTLHRHPGRRHRCDHIRVRGGGDVPVDPGEHPGGVHVRDRGLGRDHHPGTSGHQAGGERRVAGRGGHVGVAGGQCHHRRHPPGRDRLHDEGLGRHRPGDAVVVLQFQPPRAAVTGQVQHVYRRLLQCRVDGCCGGEVHDAYLCLADPGTAHRGQDVAQFAFVVQYPAAARQRRGDGHQDPQRPRHQVHGRRVDLPVHPDQLMQRRRPAGPRQLQRLPGQAGPPAGHPHTQPDR